jgi:hypothetical protein
VIDPPGRVPEQVTRWDLARTETCGGGKVFLVCPLVYGEYLGIYGAEIRVRGVPRGRPLMVCLLGLWPSRSSSGLLSKLRGCLLVQEKSSKSSVPFGLCLVLVFVKDKNKGKTATGTGH